jgi:arginine-tRNA-protein transferase
MTRGFATRELAPELYHEFMDRGFRRSGDFFYQPVCRGCRACVPIRIAVPSFLPSKSQRRCLRRDADLKVTCGRPEPTREKYELYRRYQQQWHRADMDHGEVSFISFLYESPVDTIEFCYRDAAARLIGVGLCDICSHSLSSVYFFHDPAERRRSLGTFSILTEIEHARRAGIPYYYLGYWVKGCRRMNYKAAFRPHELLGPDGDWKKVP